MNEPGNIAVVNGKRAASVRWEGNGKLIISGLGADKQFLRITEYERIKIEYE